MTRLLYVLSEHRGALDDERLARYEADRARLASLAPGVVVESVPYEELSSLDADAVVLSGSYDRWDSHDSDALERLHRLLRDRREPTLGICAGLQTMARALGGRIDHAASPTIGNELIEVLDDTCILAGIGGRFAVVAHHGDEVVEVPATLRVVARSASCAVEVVAATDRPWWGTQFHPELWDERRPAGRAILCRFLRLAGLPAVSD